MLFRLQPVISFHSWRIWRALLSSAYPGNDIAPRTSGLVRICPNFNLSLINHPWGPSSRHPTCIICAPHTHSNKNPSNFSPTSVIPRHFVFRSWTNQSPAQSGTYRDIPNSYCLLWHLNNDPLGCSVLENIDRFAPRPKLIGCTFERCGRPSGVGAQISVKVIFFQNTLFFFLNLFPLSIIYSRFC